MDAAAVTYAPAAPFSASLAAGAAAAAVCRLLKNLAAESGCKRGTQRMARLDGMHTESSRAPSPPAVETPRDKDDYQYEHPAAHCDDQPDVPWLMVQTMEELPGKAPWSLHQHHGAWRSTYLQVMLRSNI